MEEIEYIFPVILDGNISKYSVSSKGYIISTYGRFITVMKPRVTNNGYALVCLAGCEKRYWVYVHRIVAQHFIPIPERLTDVKRLEVNHIDGSPSGKLNNNVSNLEWVSSSENKYHAYAHGLHKFGEEHIEAKYTNNQIIQVCELLEDGSIPNRKIWKITGVPVSTIQAILDGSQWKHISKNYDFSNRPKMIERYDPDTKKEALDLLRNTNLSFKEIGDRTLMTRNAVWYLNKKYHIR